MYVVEGSIDTVYYDERGADLNTPCQVNMDFGSITISFDGEIGPVVYKGTAFGEGHYELSYQGGEATLHLTRDGFLEGYWKEHGKRGFWRIALDDG